MVHASGCVVTASCVASLSQYNVQLFLLLAYHSATDSNEQNNSIETISDICHVSQQVSLPYKRVVFGAAYMQL